MKASHIATWLTGCFGLFAGLVLANPAWAEKPATQPMKRSTTVRAAKSGKIPSSAKPAPSAREESAKPRRARTGAATRAPLTPPVTGGRSRRISYYYHRGVRLENRDPDKYQWQVLCGSETMQGTIDGDGVVQFKPRSHSHTLCSLQLTTGTKKFPMHAGTHFLIRNGALSVRNVKVVVFPPIPTVGAEDLSKNPRLERQWAMLAKASSEYTSSSWSAMQATGPANVNVCRDSVNAWATKPANQGIEWLQVIFAKKVRAIGTLIHASLNPGAVIKVEALTGAGWTTMWQGRDVSRGICPVVLGLRFQEPVETNSLRITLDTRLVSGWNEIDAVQLVSEPTRP